jgi:hypothetical protein
MLEINQLDSIIWVVVLSGASEYNVTGGMYDPPI